MIDSTHDPLLESWVESANTAGTDFPIQNLPLGRFRRAGSRDPWRSGVAIGDAVLDLAVTGLDPGGDLGALLSAPAATRRALRAELAAGLRRGSGLERGWRSALRDRADIELGLPSEVRGYTDFYTGIHHATAVGKLFRPDNPLLPNYKWVPIGYHGRTSSLVASGHPVIRPTAQVLPPGATVPHLAPSARLDYELELAVIIGTGNPLGSPVPMAEAEDHIAGLALLNDWSARDVQAWEYQPLGPFLAKNFGTTLSPWIVTTEALAPFRAPWSRPAGDPEPLPYLDGTQNRAAGHVAIDLEVWLQTETMRRTGHAGDRISRSSYCDAYWTMAQLVAHHTVNGCPLESGDVLGTGTLSGPLAGQGGSLLELSAGGKQPLRLSNGETRTFLADGDRVTFTASCSREGYRRIGFGSAEGTVLPARPAAI